MKQVFISSVCGSLVWGCSNATSPVSGFESESSVQSMPSANETSADATPKSKVRCLAHHVQAGIDWNKNRKSHYETLTDGESRKVSEKIIALEKFMLVGSKVFDHFAVYWNQRNTPIFCLDMDELVPEPAEFSTPSKNQFVELNPNVFKYLILLAKEDWRQWEMRLKIDINESLRHAEYNCLTRHFLESMLRSSILQRTVYPLKTKGLMRSYLMGIAVILPESQKIDTLAAPLNRQGLGILCADLPKVDIPGGL